MLLGLTHIYPHTKFEKPKYPHILSGDKMTDGKLFRLQLIIFDHRWGGGGGGEQKVTNLYIFNQIKCSSDAITLS